MGLASCRTRLGWNPALGFMCISALAVAAGSASAAGIQYQLTLLDTSHYRYTYTVINDGSLGVSVEGFDLFFDPGLYLESSLSIVTLTPPAADWDELILGSGVGVPAAYDALALAGGVPDGAIQGGFAVEFIWIGPGTPGAQPFEIFDPETFAVLESGVTTPIPETSTLSLLAVGAALLGTRSRSRRCS